MARKPGRKKEARLAAQAQGCYEASDKCGMPFKVGISRTGSSHVRAEGTPDTGWVLNERELVEIPSGPNSLRFSS
jgi:hypothetical protein